MSEPTLYQIVSNGDHYELMPVEPDYEAMAKRIIGWTYEPEGETTVGEMVAEMWRAGIGDNDEPMACFEWCVLDGPHRGPCAKTGGDNAE